MSTAALVLAVLGTMLGLGLWLMGSRYARSILTLLTVTLGAWVGLCLPRWCGWGIDGMATAVGGAVALGISGYVFTRAWNGITFGLLLACWSSLIVWMIWHGNEAWSWPTTDARTTFPQFLQALWKSMPQAVATCLPWAAGTAMLSGISIAVLWPRLCAVMLFSLAGVSMLLTTILALLENGRPQWLSAVPSATWVQAVVIIVCVMVGVFVQWRLAGLSPASAGGGGKKPK